MSLIVQASRNRNEYSLSHKENKLFNRSIEALKLNDLSQAAARQQNAPGCGASSTSAGGDSLDTSTLSHQQHQQQSTVTTRFLADHNTDPILATKDSNKKSLDNEGCDKIDSLQKTIKIKKPYWLRICTKLIRLAFSNVGLIAVVFIYSTVGALMFQLLEQHEELRLCEGNSSFIFVVVNVF